MAQVIFTNTRLQPEEIEAFLEVEYMTLDDGINEEKFPFGCGEDLQSYMKDIFNENWTELFSESECRKGITCCSIKGISVQAKNEKGSLSVNLSDGYVQARNIINNEIMQDENAQKIKEILEIAKR